jgi:HK97 family phage portal protein
MRIGPYVLFEKKAQTDEQLLDLLGGGVTTSSGIAVSSETALRVPAVAAAVRTISEAVASLRISVVSIAEDGTETEARKHPAHALLTHAANDWTSSFEMIRALMVDALTRDPGGLARVSWSSDNRPLEIIRYRPGIIGVEYDANGSGQPTYRQNAVVLNPDHVIHVRGTFDKSPVTLSREAIGAALVMEQHAAELFGNGARPSGVLRSKKPLGDEGAKKMLAGWRKAHEGRGNSGKTAVLWDDAEWQQMQLSSVDAQFQQLRLFQLQEIARAFNLPAVMIGDLSRATWSNSAEMQRMFLLLCLEPWLLAIEGALRRALIHPDERTKFCVRIERDDFSKVDLSVLAVAINGLVSSRTINPNTARDWLGLPPRDGGEEYANPNTGSSQPGNAGNPGNEPLKPDVSAAHKKDDPDADE